MWGHGIDNYGLLYQCFSTVGLIFTIIKLCIVPQDGGSQTVDGKQIVSCTYIIYIININI